MYRSEGKEESRREPRAAAGATGGLFCPRGERQARHGSLTVTPQGLSSRGRRSTQPWNPPRARQRPSHQEVQPMAPSSGERKTQKQSLWTSGPWLQKTKQRDALLICASPGQTRPARDSQQERQDPSTRRQPTAFSNLRRDTVHCGLKPRLASSQNPLHTPKDPAHPPRSPHDGLLIGRPPQKETGTCVPIAVALALLRFPLRYAIPVHTV